MYSDLLRLGVGFEVYRCNNEVALIRLLVVLSLEISEFKLLENLYTNLKERNAFKTSVLSTPLPPM